MGAGGEQECWRGTLKVWALLSLAQARRANRSDGIGQALDEATEICERRGHTQTLGKVEAERAAPTAA